MPWKVGVKTRNGYPIINRNTNEVVGYSATKQEAEGSVRARYQNYTVKGGRSPKKKK